VADNGEILIRRLGPDDRDLAREAFTVMADVFGEAHTRLSDRYVDGLLARPEFWAFASIDAGRAVGGLTGHTLPMTAFEGSEVFLYDIAVSPAYQRRGIGRRLVTALCQEAARQGISTMFVPVDDDDAEALRFYAALGGAPSKVTLFEFTSS
jgi:aminoglycoside 3-N-acetyltransferase I